eukprot:IDg5124t1
MRMRLAWMANTRPNFLFEILQLAQVTAERFEKEGDELIRCINKVIKFAVENHFSLKIPALSKNSLKIVGF